MAQESLVEKLQSSSIHETNDRIADQSLKGIVSSGHLNASAPEFIPLISNSALYVPYQNCYSGFAEHEVTYQGHVLWKRDVISEENFQKILNQVEYYFSDVNLATTDYLMRLINKDPEGFVPLSAVSSFKKIKALITSDPQLATVLRNSSKLVVSHDGKKVRRQHPLTDSAIEELQSRIVLAENLPEDHSHANLMKIFSAVGCVKSIRACQPQSSYGGVSAASRLSKMESLLFGNKVHAYVEYETVKLAEKAVSELNNEGNWRSSLRLRILLKCMPKLVHAQGRKAGDECKRHCEGAGLLKLELPTDKHLDYHQQPSNVTLHESMGEEGSPRRGRGRGRGRGKGHVHGQYHNNRGTHLGTPAKQPPRPRMPDGTRGFKMGRGKPVATDGE